MILRASVDIKFLQNQILKMGIMTRHTSLKRRHHPKGIVEDDSPYSLGEKLVWFGTGIPWVRIIHTVPIPVFAWCPGSVS